jgi:nitrogen fixation-related uncharacterized protein
MSINIDALIFVIGSGLMTIIFFGMVVWGIKTGQFKDIEEQKYLVFDRETREEIRKR